MELSSSFSSLPSTSTFLEEKFAAIMNSPVVGPHANESSPPPSYTDAATEEESIPLLQMLQDLAKVGEKYVQLSLDAYNLQNPRVELPSDPLKDISTIVGRDLSKDEIVEFLKNPGPWRPSSTYEFPFDESRKRARHTWFKTYPFCTFSYVDDGIYCVPCALRSVSRYPKNGKPIQLINAPLKRFDHFTKKMKNHTETHYHRENMIYIEALSPNWMNPPLITLQNESFNDEVVVVGAQF